MKRPLLFLLLCSTTACGGDDEPVPVPRGQTEGLVNLAVNAITESTLLTSPDGDSILLFQHEGVFSDGDAQYGVDGARHLLGIRFASNLETVWIRDYGRAESLSIAGGAWGDGRAVVLVRQGGMETIAGTVVGPAFVALALADGVALEGSALESSSGTPDPSGLSGEAETLTVIGSLRRTEENGVALETPRTELWVARYPFDVSSGPTWERSFRAETGASQGLTVAADSQGNAVLLGRGESPSAQLLSPAGTFVAKLGATRGDPLWTRAVSPSAELGDLAVTGNDDIVLSAASLDPLVDGASPTQVFTLNGLDGSEVAEIDLATDASGTLDAAFLCAGSDDDAYSVVGSFDESFLFGEALAEVENASVFVAKLGNTSNAPIFLRWSSTDVDVSVDFAECATTGNVIAGGLYASDSTSQEGAATLYLLKLSP